MRKTYRLETLALHAGQDRKEAQHSRGVPVYRTAAYLFDNTQHAANLFGLKELGNIYTRLMNPTQAILEERLAALEGGVAAVALASGTSAVFYSLINLAQKGDEIVSASNLYGGTYTMFNDLLPPLGITVKFVDVTNLQAVEGAITEKTKAVFVETVGNPRLVVSDIPGLAKIAHDHGIPLIVDATFSTPYLQRPLDQGADIVVQSLTKWLGGHGAAIGGAVIDGGKFPWNTPKFPQYSQPDNAYHGLTFGKDLGPLQPMAYALRLRLHPLRNLGAAISPDNAWIILQGIETLHLRMQRHGENALKVAEWLKKQPKVSWVNYPGLKDDPAHPLASKLFQNGFGSMVVFGIQGGAAAGARFIDSLELFSHLANVGDAKSLAIHPATTTHSQLDEEAQIGAGVTPDLVRLSVGLEHIDDILEDLDRALKKA